MGYKQLNFLNPFEFNLHIALNNNGFITECNPYKNDPEFLEELALRLEKQDKIDLSLQIRKRLEQRN